MVEMTPEEERYYVNSSTTVLYDICAEAANRLRGKYIALARAASSEGERDQLRQRMYEVADTREALDPYDRDALIAYIIQEKTELNRLRDEQV